MTIHKLKTFPDTRQIPLPVKAASVESVTYELSGEPVEYPAVLLYVRDEGVETVVRDKAGQFWPRGAKNVVIEFTEAVEAKQVVLVTETKKEPE